MKIPNKLKIGGINYQVEIVNENIVEKDFAETSFNDNTIKINKELSPEQQWVSLIHEIFHCMNSQFNSNDVMHFALEGLAQQWYQVLSDNNIIK